MPLPAIGAALGGILPGVIRGVGGVLGRVLGRSGSAAVRGIGGVIQGIGGPIVRGAGRVVRSPIGGAAVGTVAGGLLLQSGAGLFQGAQRRRSRRIDVTNSRALNRALRRVEGFERMYNRVMRSMGKPCKKVRFGGRRKKRRC